MDTKKIKEENLTDIKKEQEEKNTPFYIELLGYVALLALVILIKTYIVSPVRVSGESMEPTLIDRDMMILNKLAYKTGDIKRFDIVVIKYDGDYLIKRVIGLPGEAIEYKNNNLYVNGKRVEENFTKREIKDFNIKELGSPVVVDDYYFVVGDNRPNSKDSRIIGFIPKKDIVGKSSFTIFPFDRFGSKK